MRNLRKLTAVVIAIALVLTSMTAAFAATGATPVNGDKAIVLNELGLYAGVSSTTFDPDLESNLTREQGTILLLKLFGLDAKAAALTDAEVATALTGKTDAAKVSDWAKKAVAYAVANKIMSGKSATTVNPSDKITGAEFATLIVKTMGYDVADWTKAVTQLSEIKGSEVADEFATVNLTRDAAVGYMFGALTAETKDAKTLISIIVGTDAAKLAVAQEAGLVPATASSATVAATGAKILTVTFNGPVADTAKATFAVKKGSVTVNVSKVTFADDKKSAKVELATKLTAGDYTVSVSGVAASALTATVTAADEKVAKIEFPSANAVLDATSDAAITTTYKVSNQYGEDLTTSTNLSFTAGKGTPTYTATTGILKLTATGSTYTLGEKVAVSAIHAGTSTFASAVLTVVAKAAVSDVTIDSLYNVDSKTPTAGDTGSIYKLVVTAKDQYGNAVANTDIAKDVIVTVSNTTVADIAGGAGNPSFTTTTISGSSKTVLALNGTLTAGTSTIAIISKSTGKVARFDVVVKESVKVDTLTLSAPELAVAGEKVNIPFTAVDQFGAAMTSATDINNGLSSKSAGDVASLAFKQDYVKNTPYLELDLTNVTAATTVFITAVTKTNKVVTLQVSVVDPKKPVVINNTDSLTTNVAVGGTITLSENNLIAKDQYGRDITPNFGLGSNQYTYEVTTSDSSVVSVNAGSTATISLNDGSVTLKGEAKGTATITATIKKGGVEVANSAITFDIKVVNIADIASYELADFSKLYQASAGTYDVDVTVNGLLADKSKVAVPTTLYNVTINDAKVGYSSVTDKVYSVARTAVEWGTATTIDIPVIVTVKAATPVILTKNVTVCAAAPAIETVSLASGDYTNKEADGVVSAAYTYAKSNLNALVVDAVKAVDQYGVTVTETASDYAYITATGFATDKNIDNIAAGDTFNVVAVTKTGKSITFKVIAK